MSFTIQQQRDFIEKHFLKNNIVNHIPDRVDNNVDPFIPSQPPTLDVKTKITNTSYKYLDDLMLSNDLVLFPRNLLEEYKIHICPFSVNTKLETPFLQFMFSKNNSQYTFPVFDLDMKSIQESSVSKIMYSNDDDDDSDSDQEENNSVNNEFLHQCIRFFHDNILKETDIDDDTDIKTRYRGFMEQDDTNNLYVFFDCTDLHIDVYNNKFKTNEYVFAIVDEINKRKINDVYIDNDIITLFQKNSFITELNTRNGEPVVMPIISHICSENDDKNYINLYNDVNENDTDDILLIPPQIDHPIYHDTYVFSTKALNGNYTNIKRFALFYEELIQETENMEIETEENDKEHEETENMEVEIKENDKEPEETENMDESSDESNSDSDVSSDESGSDIDESIEESDSDIDESIEESDSDIDESIEESDSDIDESNEESNSDSDVSSDESNSDSDVSSDESNSDSDVSSEESNSDMDVILEENVVFTFKNENEQSFYGTYSIETFIEI
jgi:hypothetical protein